MSGQLFPAFPAKAKAGTHPSSSQQSSAAARLVALLDHLGLGRAHIAAQIPGDIAELAASDPERLAGIVLCTPLRLDPAPFWRYREDHVLSLLTGEELPTWHEARAKAAEDGLLLMAHPLHCAVGTKPG